MNKEKKMTSRPIVRQTRGVIFILVLASVVGLGMNAFRGNALPWVQDWEVTMNERNRNTMPETIETVDIAQMSRLYQSKDVLVLDARPEDFWKFERIPGSKSLPVENAELLVPELLSKIPREMKIITYCDGGSCHSSRELGEKILKAGHGKVAVFIGGMEEWMSGGKPIESDENG